MHLYLCGNVTLKLELHHVPFLSPAFKHHIFGTVPMVLGS